ncbi:hypothetical protein ATANTOWER_018809 [Ataeniobius toweri]|uniref:Uncharacterized protein n=1 Tax=Ataeniobius toweri TaxID=208326 RepID=A0ABU7A708_9TELE|nr:hypothetical protein [Ataeniobius toweri]
MANLCRRISWPWGTENTTGKKKRLRGAANQRDDGELKERGAAPTEFGEIRVKELGPDKPDIIINQQTKEKNKVYNCSFWNSWFEPKLWLTGCDIANAFSVFPAFFLIVTNMI